MSDPVLVAKMYLNSVARVHNEGNANGESELIKLGVVYGNGEANKQWSKWTPSGHLELNITNPDAMGKVQPGGYYKVLLVPCGKDD